MTSNVCIVVIKAPVAMKIRRVKSRVIAKSTMHGPLKLSITINWPRKNTTY